MNATNLAWYEKRDRAERRRAKRLIRKAQKAKVLQLFEDIVSLPSWSKRFHQVAKLRAQK